MATRKAPAKKAPAKKAPAKKAPAKKPSPRTAFKAKRQSIGATTRKRPVVYVDAQGRLHAQPGTKYHGKKINRRRPYKRNGLTIKRLLNKDLLMQGGLVVAGVVAGSKVQDFVAKSQPEMYIKLGKFGGAIPLLAGAVLGAMVQRKEAKSIAMGMVGSGIWSIASNFVPQIPAPVMGASFPMSARVDNGYGLRGIPSMGADASLVNGMMFADSSLVASPVSGSKYYDDMDGM